MACYHPLISYSRIGKDGERIHKIIGHHDLPRTADSRYPAEFICKDGYYWFNRLEIPCGHCIGCRLEYSRQWALRCCLEAKYFDSNYFLTLTYDDDHVPLNFVDRVSKYTGEVDSVAALTLCKDDVQKFNKRLRAYFDRVLDHSGIRFFLGGEYGSNTHRPHYHGIYFNLPIPDLEYFFSHNGFPFYTSKIISGIWGKGQVLIGDVSFETCAYVARYIMKKEMGPHASEYYDSLGVVPEFSLMSRRPGIGYSYFADNAKLIYENDSIILRAGKDEVKYVKPPKYFDDKEKAFDPDTFESVVEARVLSGRNRFRQEMARTSLERLDYLKVKESNKEKQLSALVRPL